MTLIESCKRRTDRNHLLAEILFARSSLLSAAFENIYNVLSFRSHDNKLTGSYETWTLLTSTLKRILNKKPYFSWIKRRSLAIRGHFIHTDVNLDPEFLISVITNIWHSASSKIWAANFSLIFYVHCKVNRYFKSKRA